MPLQLPSLHYLLAQARASLLRFPLSLLAAAIAVGFSIFLIETNSETFNRFPYINAMLCAALGIPLYFCVVLVSERLQYSRLQQALAELLASLVLLGIYFSLPDADNTHNTSLPYIRYGVYNIVVHLLVAFAPFLFVRQLNGFWNYNKSLFLRILLAILYSGFLYVGLVLALLALRLLFEVEFEEELFAELFVVIIGLFNTWFFVAGVPADFDALEENTDYPRGLKVFTQYVLLPLLLLYLVILYVYGFKIVLSWNWPKGIVSYLIMCVSVLGVLTLLLIYPYARQTENRWIMAVSKAYYLLLLPLLVLLFLAIGMRLADYGFTINRYIIVAIGVWLTVICVYFLSGRNNIKFVPMSLAAMLLLISIGPWGMFAVSERSQVKRLEAVLSHSGLLASGKVVGEVYWLKDSLPTFYSPQEKQNEGRLTDSLHNEVMSIMDYLDNHHGFDAIQPWYVQNLDSMLRVADADTSLSQWELPHEASIYVKSLGIAFEYKMTYEGDGPKNFYRQYTSNSANALDVQGYKQLIFLHQLYYQPVWQKDLNETSLEYERTVIAARKAYKIRYSPATSEHLIILTGSDTLRFPLRTFLAQLTKTYPAKENHQLPTETLSLPLQQNNRMYKLILDRVSFLQKDDSLLLESIEGKLLIGDRE